MLLLGETRDELAGSEWAHVVHGHLGGLPPTVDLAAEQRARRAAGRRLAAGLLAAAHDVSDGGLAQTLVEMALRGGVGASVAVPGGLDPFVFLCSESTARAVVAVRAEQRAEVLALCAEHDVPVAQVGTVTDAATLVVEQAYGAPVAWTLEQLRTASEATLPALFA